MMNSLSRQALNYLNLSENNDKQARNRLCCLILLLEKDYQSKVNLLDEVLLLHILNHLTECYLESICFFNKEKYTSTQQLIKRLTLSDLTISDINLTAFNRCTYYSRALLSEFNGTNNTESIILEAKAIKNDSQAETNIDAAPVIDDFTETECNQIPAPELINVKIESHGPSAKNKHSCAVYSLHNQKHNPVLE